MLDGKRLWSAFCNGYCDDIPNGPQDRTRTAETWHDWRFFISGPVHSQLLPLLAHSAVNNSFANGDSWLLAYRRGERLCVAGNLQYEPATLWGYPPSHQQVRKLTALVSFFLMIFCLCAKHLQLRFSSQHYCGSEVEREQDTLRPLFFTQSLWQPHISEPHQEWYQLCGRRSFFSAIQPAGEQKKKKKIYTYVHAHSWMYLGSTYRQRRKFIYQVSCVKFTVWTCITLLLTSYLGIKNLVFTPFIWVYGYITHTDGLTHTRKRTPTHYD